MLSESALLDEVHNREMFCLLWNLEYGGDPLALPAEAWLAPNDEAQSGLEWEGKSEG
jgi:hypothetical protein